ncbi:MAG: DsrE family protein [Flavobacteriaceae bacterium]|nr:DsrE family protein [Flavobacteriaceae bacterium]
MRSAFLLLPVLFLSITNLLAQERSSGPVIENFGATYEVSNPDIETHMEEVFQVVFDVKDAPEDASEVNKWIATVARFLNMHVAAGKPVETLEVALVLHGNAAYALLNQESYQQKYEVENPNIALIEALDAAGVDIILCGQTAAHRDISKERRIPQAQVALSAMTALIQLQNQNYTLINF